MPTVIGAKSVRKGDLVHETYFMGNEGQLLAKIGTLVMDIGSWQLFGAALLLGADKTLGPLKVIFQDQEEIVEKTGGE